MNSDIPIIVLTRFNLKINFTCDKRHDSKIPNGTGKAICLDEDYLSYRFQIFEKYTFPSFTAQSDGNFKWVVLFHSDTPGRFMERINRMEKEFDRFHACFLDDSECENHREWISRWIMKHCTPQKPVITVRVDNDDYIHADFIAAIRREFLSVGNMSNTIFLTYPNGLQYDIRNEQILSFRYVNNHFLSLFSPVNNGDHVLSYNHAELDHIVREDAKKIKIEKNISPIWVEMITETNYSNAPRWRFSTIWVPFCIKDEFPLLNIWKNKREYLSIIIKKFFLVFIYRGKGLLYILIRRLKE